MSAAAATTLQKTHEEKLNKLAEVAVRVGSDSRPDRSW